MENAISFEFIKRSKDSENFLSIITAKFVKLLIRVFFKIVFRFGKHYILSLLCTTVRPFLYSYLCIVTIFENLSR